MRRLISAAALLCLATTAPAEWRVPVANWTINQDWTPPPGATCEVYPPGPAGRRLQRRAGLGVRGTWSGRLCTTTTGTLVGILVDGRGYVRCELEGACGWLAAWCDADRAAVRTTNEVCG